MTSKPPSRPDLAELRRLHEEDATPGPWSEFCESGEWWIERCNADGSPAGDVVVSNADDVPISDIVLIIRMRNALPWLLDQAEAAERLRAIVTDLANSTGWTDMDALVLRARHELGVRCDCQLCVDALLAGGGER